MQPVNRRQAIRELAGLGLGLSASLAATAEERPPNRIKVENARPGTRDWMLSGAKIDPKSKYRCPWIEGYCSHSSIRTGETIQFFVSTDPASEFTLNIYRMGYYGGDGGRLMQQLGPFQGRPQPEPPIGEKRVRNCEWEAAAELKIPSDWLSGVYLGK